MGQGTILSRHAVGSCHLMLCDRPSKGQNGQNSAIRLAFRDRMDQKEECSIFIVSLLSHSGLSGGVVTFRVFLLVVRNKEDPPIHTISKRPSTPGHEVDRACLPITGRENGHPAVKREGQCMKFDLTLEIIASEDRLLFDCHRSPEDPSVPHL